VESPEGPESRILAWKGKAGPCYETGRSAAYLGSAAAALDDDGHLLFGRLRLCEKTATLYRSPAYAGRVEVSEADPALLARLERAPMPFDCDTFERDATALAGALEPPEPPEPSAAVYYPGPFRLLVLRDGRCVRRGDRVRLPRTAAEALIARDGALASADGAPAEDYRARFRESGPACLLEEGVAGALQSSAPRRADLAALGAAPPALRERLRRFLERGDDYFLLGGSDPADPAGCCPSDDVGAARTLVRAGILDSCALSPDAACPATIFAFAGELTLEGGRAKVDKNEALRRRALAYLRSGAGILPRVLVRALLFGVMALGLAGLAWGLLRGC
jgi:hypothetical protein